MNRAARTTAHVRLPLPAEFDPAGVLERLRGDACPWLLESALVTEGIGRHSFVGSDPYAILRTRGSETDLECRRAVHEGLRPGIARLPGDALEALRRVMPTPPEAASEAPFCGGAVGYFGYELAEQLDAHDFHTVDDLGLPDAIWLLVDALVVFDHATGNAAIEALGFAEDPTEAERRAQRSGARLADRLAQPAPTTTRRTLPRERRTHPPSDPGAGPHTELDVASYHKAVHDVGDAIAAGDLYQACLTYRIDRPFPGDPWQLYRTLRARDPAPFAAYLELPELTIAGNSPERFLRVDADGRVESRPIKGTAPRGDSPQEDAELRARLAASEKDRAENVMIVDLVRNDLGRVCETGSVEVPELFTIEPYASVFQLVSTVTGQLRPDRDALDAVAAAFPPGSMTGAPKIAAMRMLDRLERVRRGIYSGAIGYLDARGGADLSVVIRTAFVRDGRAYLHAGGGLVADSEASKEYEETRDKLRSLLRAIDACANATSEADDAA